MACRLEHCKHLVVDLSSGLITTCRGPQDVSVPTPVWDRREILLIPRDSYLGMAHQPEDSKLHFAFSKWCGDGDCRPRQPIGSVHNSRGSNASAYCSVIIGS